MRELMQRCGALVLSLALVFPPSASKPTVGVSQAVIHLTERDQRPDPSVFSPEELQLLQQRFRSMAPRPRWPNCSPECRSAKPLRDLTQSTQPTQTGHPQVCASSDRPMLVMAILFDEIQHSKPGKSSIHCSLWSGQNPRTGAACRHRTNSQNRLPANPTRMKSPGPGINCWI